MENTKETRDKRKNKSVLSPMSVSSSDGSRGAQLRDYSGSEHDAVACKRADIHQHPDVLQAAYNKE